LGNYRLLLILANGWSNDFGKFSQYLVIIALNWPSLRQLSKFSQIGNVTSIFQIGRLLINYPFFVKFAIFGKLLVELAIVG